MGEYGPNRGFYNEAGRFILYPGTPIDYVGGLVKYGKMGYQFGRKMAGLYNQYTGNKGQTYGQSMRRALGFPGRGYVRRSGFYGKYRHKHYIESKFFDVNVVLFTIDDVSGNFTNLNLVSQGTEADDRIGQRFTLVSVSLRFSILLPDTNVVTQTRDLIRIIVYVDKQCNGATPDVGDLLTPVGPNVTIWPYNTSNSYRFKYLFDKTLAINSASGPNSSNIWPEVAKPFTIGKRLHIPIEMDIGATITDVKSNNLAIFIVSENNRAQMSFTSRIRFTDS